MKRYLLILFILLSLCGYSQRTNTFKDSSIFYKAVVFDSTIYITKGASNGKVLTSNGIGLATWQTINVGGRSVDTIYKNNTKDSIVFTISGIRYAVKDSFNLNTDSQTLSISNDTLTISGGNSVILPVYIQIDSSTINSYDVLNSQNTPPISPNTGDVYLVGNVPTGAWVGHAKDIAEWNGSAWVFTDGVQGDFLYNATNALTYIFRSGNWVQTTGIPALNNGNSISSGLRIGTNNARSLTFETNNTNRGRFDSIGRFHVYNLPTSADTFVSVTDVNGKFGKVGKSSFLSGVNGSFIPLSGTVSGSPVTGDVSIQDDLLWSLKNNQQEIVFNDDGSGVQIIANSGTEQGILNIGSNSVTVSSTDTTSRGISGMQDHSANITDLDYTQKIYVDNAISSNRKVDTSYIFRNSTLDSLCQITVINGISYRSCGKDSVGAGSSTLALDKITDAVDSSTLNAGNYKQEWKWNSLANNTGFKLSSTSGGLLNTQNRLFEVVMSGAMPGTGSSSYTGYFKNTQTVGSAYGLYAEGGGAAIQANGAINIISGALQLGGSSGGVFYRNSGNTFLQSASSEGLILQSSNGIASIHCGSNELGLVVSRKTLNQRYVLGIGGSGYQSSVYLSQNTTATLIEKDLGKLIFSANTGLAGGFASFTPNNIMTINGGATEATSNVGIGTTSPVASAKLEVSSTTSGFLPPRMTATQASAISSPAQGLLLFVSDTNGTFTSVGWWGYNGATWEKLNN